MATQVSRTIGPDVPDEQALGVRDGDVLDAVRERGLDLGDARVEVPGGVVGFPDQADLFRHAGRVGRADDAGHVSPDLSFPEAARGAPILPFGDGRGRQGGLLDLFERKVVRVAEPRLLAGEHPDPAADPDALGGLLDDVVFHEDVIAGAVFQEDLREVPALRQGEDERRPEVLGGEPEMIDVRQHIPHYTRLSRPRPTPLSAAGRAGRGGTGFRRRGNIRRCS